MNYALLLLIVSTVLLGCETDTVTTSDEPDASTVEKDATPAPDMATSPDMTTDATDGAD